jgi:hypothetical protein
VAGQQQASGGERAGGHDLLAVLAGEVQGAFRLERRDGDDGRIGRDRQVGGREQGEQRLLVRVLPEAGVGPAGIR